jgi:uncharacterized protein YbbC (DUF1343 family)
MKLPLTLVVLALATSVDAATPVVRTGIEVLRDNNFDVVQGKRVGLITNPTGVDSRLQSTIDILCAAKGVRLVALFGPEHGVRGDYAAGDSVGGSVDAATGLPVYSLYGKTRAPNASMLRGLDALVYDIQDIGCRSYTYISTMGLAMEAAAEQNIEFIVLDRPNPLGGIRVEGAPVITGFTSFVSQYPIPYVYGLTCGELARFLNNERLLRNGLKCRLTVVPMKGWKRTMSFVETGLPWVPTSPHVPESTSPMYYVSTGVVGELGVFSEGVGTTMPFHILAAAWIDPLRLAERLNGMHLPGVLFRPIVFRPFYGRDAGKELKGVQIHITEYDRADLMEIQFRFLQAHAALYPDKNPFVLADESRRAMFDKVVGDDSPRRLLTQNITDDGIRTLLTRGVEDFKQRSRASLLYL